MRKSPFISIIIPTLNEEKYLPKLLAHLSKQTYTDFEVIVVDAHSEDKTQSVVNGRMASFSKKHVNLQLIISKKRNVSAQRNLGAKKARGNYLFFFDADVSFEKDYLERVVRRIKNEDISFVTTWVDVDSKDPQDKLIAFLHNMLFEVSSFIEMDFVPGFNCIVYKQLFNTIGGFSEKVVIAEDQHFAHKAREIGTQLTILKEPRIIFSLRRYREEGRLTVLRKYTRATLHIMFKGPVMKELFEYQMGGQRYSLKKPKLNEKMFNKSMSQWRARVNKILLEFRRI